MRKTQIVVGALLIALLLTLGACAPAPALTPSPAPAEFEVISLDIKPPEAVAGEIVSITAVVKNIGGSEGTYAVILTVDGVTVEAKEVAITPGSSKVLTFSLVKDAPGTYEIGVGELSSSLEVKERLVVKKEVALKYDEGIPESYRSQGPGWGYSVHFSPPATPFTISKVRVMAGLYGTEYADLKASLEIWSQDFDVLHSHEMPATDFSHEEDWVIVEINIVVDGDFRVVFFTNSGRKEGGICIGYDLSGNKASEVARAGGTLAEWPLPMEETSPRERTNWMIRVVGTPADEGTPVTSSPPQTVEGSAEFQEAVSLLDSPQKLSRWMLNNINYESHYERWKETGVDYIASPEETFNSRAGCCAEFAVFACYVLESHGYAPKIFRIAVESNPRKNHVVCAYKLSGSLYTINIGRMEGAFLTYEDIAFEHDKDWSEYDVYYSWEKFQKRLGAPDKIVHRE